MSTKVLKDTALETYYQGLFAMYSTPGWKMLMEDAERMREVHDSVASLTTNDQLWFRKGELSQMEWLLSHQATAEATYAALIAEQEGEDEVVPTGGIAKVIS